MRRIVALAVAAASLVACGDGEPTVTMIEIDGRPSAVAIAAGKVWVTDDENHVVWIVDPETNEVDGEPIEVERGPIAIAQIDADVWVAHASGWLVQIDGLSRRVARRIRTKGSLTGVSAILPMVWATDLENDRVVAVDAQRGRVAQRVEVAAGAVRLIADQQILVSGRENEVTVLDDDGHELARHEVGAGPIGLAQGCGEWVANSDDGTVSPVGVAAPAVDVGRGPIALEFTDDCTMWVANQDDSTLSVVRDGEQIDVIELGVSPREMATDGTDLWIAGTNPEGVVRVAP